VEGGVRYGDNVSSAWWADGPGPAWLHQGGGSGPLDLSAAPPCESSLPSRPGRSRGDDGGGGEESAAAPAALCFAPSSAPNADATFWPAGEVRRSKDPSPEEVRSSGAESDPWRMNLRGSADDDFATDDPLIFGKPKPRSRFKEPSSEEGLSSGGDADPWKMNLRGSADDDFATDDPLIFGKPKPRNRFNKRSKPKPSPDENPPPSAAEAEETSAWISGLRASPDNADAVDDFSVCGKPRTQQQQPRKRAQQKPPRPDPEYAEVSSLGGSGSASGSRPSSGFFSKQTPNVGKQMPEALRRRLDHRGDNRVENCLRERKGSRGDPCGASPGPGEDSPKPSEVRAALLERARKAAQAEADQAVKLPPLGPDGQSRGRRCSSQPPNEPAERGPSRQKKPARPKSMCNARANDDEEGGRQMFDKNTLRTRSRDLFMPAITQYRQEKCQCNDDQHPTSASSGGGSVRVFVRKRPMFEKDEVQHGDFDITSIIPGRPSTHVVLHNCLFQADLKTPFVSHLTFSFDRVFDEKVENIEVYQSAAAPLVKSSLDGGVSTMFMFGQTGSGKTFTMSAIQEVAARELFEGADGDEPWIAVQFVELRGNRCFDLLAPGIPDGRRNSTGARPELRIREHGDGSYTADGAVDLYPKTAEELCTVMHMAQSRRATSSTEANDVSSRSHSVCTLRLFQSEGQLMLVDCAGTERRKDSMFHSKERQQEGAEINASLHALKECVRLLTTQQRVPSHAYRASSLTKVLADAFIRGSEAQLAVVCTASPCATDTEHTIATLRMGMSLGGRGTEHEEKQSLLEIMQAQKKPRLVLPKQWTPEQVMEWFASIGDGRFQDVLNILPSNFTGQMLVRVSESRCVQLCGGSEKRGRHLFDLLHQEMQRAEVARKG